MYAYVPSSYARGCTAAYWFCRRRWQFWFISTTKVVVPIQPNAGSATMAAQIRDAVVHNARKFEICSANLFSLSVLVCWSHQYASFVAAMRSFWLMNIFYFNRLFIFLREKFELHDAQLWLWRLGAFSYSIVTKCNEDIFQHLDSVGRLIHKRCINKWTWCVWTTLYCKPSIINQIQP